VAAASLPAPRAAKAGPKQDVTPAEPTLAPGQHISPKKPPRGAKPGERSRGKANPKVRAKSSPKAAKTGAKAGAKAGAKGKGRASRT